MIKHQNIFFDNSLSFDINRGGIIKDDTEILNLFFHDNTNSNSMCLIGNKLEWKPKIWTEFEREKIIKVKEINIVCLLGDLTGFFHWCQKQFNNIKVNYYSFPLYLQASDINDTLSRKKFRFKQIRTQGIFASIGTMRLNRYILTKEGLEKGYDFYFPKITHDNSKDFEYQISQCLNIPKEEAI